MEDFKFSREFSANINRVLGDDTV